MENQFKRHVVETYGIPDRDFDRLYDEFLEHFGSNLETFVRRRHVELQAEGLKNVEIFARLLEEARRFRFTAEGLNERRLRRIVYG
jgi:hypothetical protein